MFTVKYVWKNMIVLGGGIINEFYVLFLFSTFSKFMRRLDVPFIIRKYEAF